MRRGILQSDSSQEDSSSEDRLPQGISGFEENRIEGESSLSRISDFDNIELDNFRGVAQSEIESRDKV